LADLIDTPLTGQEKTSEIAHNTTTALFWEYDSRIGRRWNVDPKSNLYIIVYSCFAGNPVFFRDNLGDTVINGQKMEGEKVPIGFFAPVRI